MRSYIYPTATDVMSGKHRLINIDSQPRSAGLFDRMTRKMMTRMDHGMSVRLLQSLYSDKAFAARSGFLPDKTRVAFNSTGTYGHHIVLIIEGRPTARIEWDYEGVASGGLFGSRQEWMFDLRIGDNPVCQKDLDFESLKKALDRPLTKPAETNADATSIWDRPFTLTSFDYLSWLVIGGTSIALSAATSSAIIMFAGAGMASLCTIVSKIGIGPKAPHTEKTVGLSDPMTLYRLMSANLETAQRYANLAERAAKVKAKLGASMEVDDIHAMTGVSRTIPRVIESCLATLDTLQSEGDRRGVLMETAATIEEVLTMAEARIAEREKDAIAVHRDLLAGAKQRKSEYEMPSILH